LDRYGGAELGAPPHDLGLDGVADFAGAGELLVVGALESGRVGETPMQTGGDSGKYGAAFSGGRVADGDDVGEAFAGLIGIEDGFGLVAGDVYADFLHGFDNDGVEFAGLEAGALGFKLFTAHLVEEGFRHLAARAVVGADEKHFFPVHIQGDFSSWWTARNWGLTHRRRSKVRMLKTEILKLFSFPEVAKAVANGRSLTQMTRFCS
jgi:hypothetical protein